MLLNPFMLFKKREITLEHSNYGKKSLAEKYDMFASKFNELYLADTERGHGSMTEALDNAHQQLTARGEFSAERGAELKRYLTRDLYHAIADAQTQEDEIIINSQPDWMQIKPPLSQTCWN